MPASMQPVVSPNAAPVAADVSQANPSAAGAENGKPFADTLSQQMEKHAAREPATDKSAAAKPAPADTENGKQQRQELASSGDESGKTLPPQSQKNATDDCECDGHVSTVDMESEADSDNTEMTEVLQQTRLDIQHGLEQAMQVGQMPKFERALDNVTKNDTRSALLDLLHDIQAQGVDEVIARGSGEVKGGEPVYNPLLHITERNQVSMNIEEQVDADFSDMLMRTPLNAMDLPKGLEQWLGSDEKAGDFLAAVYSRHQRTTYVEAHGVSMNPLKQDMLKALQMEVGSEFELAGDFKGSAEVLNAQREVTNLQAMFGGKGDKSFDGGIGGLFKLIALQKVATAVNDAQLGDKLQFQQMLQNNLLSGSNQALFNAMNKDACDCLPLLQANGALMNPQGGAQGSQSLPNILMSSSTIHQPLGQPQWERAVGERLQWMVNKEVQQAELKLNPRHLGPIEVKISMGQEQTTSVHFSAAHHVTRDALEAAIPRLREMLGENGMTQVDVNVSQHSFNQGQQAQGDQGQGSHHASATGIEHADGHASIVEDEAVWHSIPLPQGGNRLLDIFA